MVIAVLREATACAEARDFLRLSALLTDEAAQRAAVSGVGAIASGTPEATPELNLDVVLGPNRSLPESRQIQDFTVTDVQEAPHGRITAFTVRSTGDGSRYETLMVFVREGNRLLIADEVHLHGAGTPAP
jgi:hypothetical protein